jgi:histidinol-phosphatase (PHP family)
MKKDGHIHTPFCPHGSSDELRSYVYKAVAQGFEEISFTEHAPLPPSFKDPTPLKDSAMKVSEMELYIEQIEKVKKEFQKEVKINVGLEVDYINEYEEETRHFLNTYGPYLDDSLLSVHFLNKEDSFYCLDYSAEEFEHIITKFGSVEEVYKAYFKAVASSVKADLGSYKPKRIGHITLVRKFQKKFPCEVSFQNEVLHILNEVKNRNLELDYNAAGFHKPLCQEAYPSKEVVALAQQKNIPLVYGSDAHCAKDVGQSYTKLFER